jgi:type I restriction enzyme M protein
MITGDLKSQVDKVWNAFWTGGLSNPLSVIEQMTYLLFIRRLDELQTQLENKASITKKPIDNPIFLQGQQELRWNRFKDLDPEIMFHLFRKEKGVFDFMVNYGVKDSSFAKYMKGATFMIPTPRLLAQVVELISNIPMQDRDTKGDVYEYLLSKIATAGQNGQFRTPRHIIKMMVELVKPGIEDIIVDPSAGSCGFLVAASEYVRKHHKQDLMKIGNQKHFNEKMFLGMEFDPTMIRIGAMNMMLHGIENPQIKMVDALSEDNTGFTEKATIALANPPFKGSLDKEIVDGKILKIVDSSKTELLFLALILKGLKVGGRCAVIVPDGVLFGSSKAHLQIRKEIIDNQKLEGVISMPAGVFRPYAGVSTAILIFTKTKSGGTDKVWFYNMSADGFSLDDKRNTLGDGGKQSHEQNNIPDIIKRFHSRSGESKRKRTEQSFLVQVKDIRDNKYDLSINRYREIRYEGEVHLSPNKIIEQIESLDKERNALMEDLKRLLS